MTVEIAGEIPLGPGRDRYFSHEIMENVGKQLAVITEGLLLACYDFQCVAAFKFPHDQH